VSPHANTVRGGIGSTPQERLIRGVTVGRYIVIDLVGAGGMGAVYAAYDPELGRKVALKLLLPGGTLEPSEQRRLLREAQVMARLSHPNLCTVHDVGIFHEQVFIAMEFIQGVTLRAWLQQHSRSWEQVLAVLVAVGRGLAAAHAVGVVHCDLKPDNVMLGADGRPRVMDFGIARTDRAVDDTDISMSHLSQRTNETFTDPGPVRGTPHYMAPEQWSTRQPTKQSDQFSFCVMVWEALYGERPFAEAASDRDGELQRLRTPPSSAHVPAWLRRTLTRGLSAHPMDRYPSLDALLTELAAVQMRRRRRWLVGGTAVVALTLGGAMGARLWQTQRHVEACEAAGASLGTEVWTDDTRGRTKQALIAAKVPDAAATGDRVANWVDTFVARWQQGRYDACMAGDEQVIACLADHRQRLELLLAAMLETSERGLMAKAIHVAATLPDPRTCNEPVHVRRFAASDESEPVAAALRDDLRRGQMLTETGRAAEAASLLQGVRERADVAGLRALVIEAKAHAGVAAGHAADYATAERLLREALLEAASSGLDVIAVEAGSQLVSVVGTSLARPAEALLIGEFTEALVHRLGQTDRPLHARLLRQMAVAQHLAGDVREALQRSRRALDIFQRELGGAHPDLAAAIVQVANQLKDLGDYRQALVDYKKGLEVAVAVFGEMSIPAGMIQGNMGTLYLFLGQQADGLAAAKKSFAAYESSLDAGHPDVARAHSNLANAFAHSGDLPAAVAEHQKAVTKFEAAMGPMHRDLGGLLHDFAYAQFLSGDKDKAIANLRRALAIWEATLKPNDPRLASVLGALGDTLLNSGQPDEGLALLERSVRVGEAGGMVPERLADARVSLAKAVWTVRRDRDEALAISEHVAAAYRKAGPIRADELAELEAWMREVKAAPTTQR